MYKITTNALQTAVYFQKLAVQVPARVGAVVHRGAYQLQRDIQALAPMDTGRYRASISVEGMSGSRFMYLAEVGSDVEYGPMLEFGGFVDTPNGPPVYRAPEPHFGPAADAFEPEFIVSISLVLV